MKNKIMALVLSVLSACDMYPAVSAERHIDIPETYDPATDKIDVGISIPVERNRNTFHTAHIHECDIDVSAGGTRSRDLRTATYHISKIQLRRMFTEDSRYTFCRIFEQPMTITYTVTYVYPRPFEGPLAAVTYRENFRLVP